MVELVLRRFAIKLRVYPTKEQEQRLLSWEASLRFLWNLANEQRLMGLARPRGERVYPSAYDQQKELTALRAELPWLADVPRNVCGLILSELERAWDRCFKRSAQRPRWKRKGIDCIGVAEPHPNLWRISGSTLHFPKLGPMRAVVHREIVGKPKRCTIKRDGDQWFASILCEVEAPEPAPRHEPVVALDRGIVNIVADSDGRVVPNPKHLDATLKRLARAQRVVSRRKKGSKNREKAKRRVMRLHRKVRRQREHVLHVLSAGYAKSHGTVIVESLRTKDMVKVGGGLGRSIGSAGWGVLVRMLTYKLTWSGGRLVEVPAAYSSQECHGCGYVAAENRPTQARFECGACGLVEHADLNAALVLKSRANRSALPVEGSVPKAARRSRKRSSSLTAA